MEPLKMIPPLSALAAAESKPLAGLVDYADGAIVSKVLKKGAAGTLTVFAFDTGQDLSEHTAPFDAFVLMLDGRAEVTIGGRVIPSAAGEIVLMPANVPHSVHATGRFKMLLMMIRDVTPA